MEQDPDDGVARFGIAGHHLRQLGPGVPVRIMEREMLAKPMRPFVSVILRVPSLFVIDMILNRTLDFGDFENRFPWLTMIMLFYAIIGAAVIFVLPTTSLVTLFVFIFTLATLRTSYWWSGIFVSKLEDSNTTNWDIILPSQNQEGGIISATDIVFSIDFVLYIAMQAAYAFLFCVFTSKRTFSCQNTVKYFWIFMLPVLTKLGLQAVFMSSPETTETVMTLSKYLHVIPGLLEVGALVVSKILMLRYKVYTYYLTCKYVVQNFGIQSFIEDQWVRLEIPSVLRVFWLLRFSLQLIETTYSTYYTQTENSNTSISYWNVTMDLSTSSCDSSLAVLGLSAVVAIVTHHIGALTDKFLGGNSDEVANIGPVSAVLFFILALQTGLAGLEPGKRFIRLYRNCILLITALLHFFHGMVNQVMMTLSTSHTTSISRHARALIMCTILIIFPFSLVIYLWSTAPMGTWLFAVTAFCMELVIKVVITFIIYVLFLVDTHSNTFWEDLDDYVYYIKAVGSTVEFIVGIFLLGNGLWILLMESGGIIRGIMIGIHAYFNIFQLGKDGWKKFKNRRMAVKKINSLPEANPAQLGDHNDVCAICYQELVTARITPCGHLFHALCLRKWLYVQDSCPLCHKEIMQVQQQQDEEVEIQRDEAGGQNDEAVRHRIAARRQNGQADLE